MANTKSIIIFILALGIFGIINTEMGVIGILPQIANNFNISVSQAGLLVSLFALAVAISGPFLPMLFSRMNRKSAMLLVIGVFLIANIISIFAPNFTVALIARVVPAFLHPVYFSAAFTAAAASVNQDQAPKAIAKVFMGLTAGMVIGIPISSFIADVASLEYAMSFFAIINGISFLSILLFIPSMPVRGGQSYGKQLVVMKKPLTWLSLGAVIFIVSGMYAVYSFFAEYLSKVTNMPEKEISIMLILFGSTGIAGNLLAGKWLSRKPVKTAVIYPIVAALIYLLVFLLGDLRLPMVFLIAVWGALFTFALNLTQYWISSAAPEAPEFANGLFVSFSNLGITVGTSVGGLFISGMGTHDVVWAGLLMLAAGFIFITIRALAFNEKIISN
ncbi:putative MFS family arabinose efflux permease [Paenibacillus rhizosphaerae]|uniref:Putative MFS family arabinose efflux permease n=1 Tax=Paenibacillus rhizosphaerae TaxID=297318 RepID=A0A839TFV7_9BACL|nr:MFS transporter [Paenibacillus rhizosphaerae]MBB3125492.1 putative MFS family arabinose efflux permease [Paenibacillus rhizosphaerae]